MALEPPLTPAHAPGSAGDDTTGKWGKGAREGEGREHVAEQSGREGKEKTFTRLGDLNSAVQSAHAGVCGNGSGVYSHL